MTEMNTSGLKHGSKSIKSQVIITYFNDHRYAIVAYGDPYGLFAEVISEGKKYHYCNGELHIVYDEKGNEIWRISYL